MQPSTRCQLLLRDGAQRLSATLMDARGLSWRSRHVGPIVYPCSTPFGDIDGCNALSRMCSTPFGDIDGCTSAADVDKRPLGISSGAQRLSATLMDARRRCRVSPGVRSAQRLSATLMDARTVPPLIFARHGCGAQRLSATLMDALRSCFGDGLVEETPACSTPFGDIDGCTIQPRVRFQH